MTVSDGDACKNYGRGGEKVLKNRNGVGESTAAALGGSRK
jgi:hypothetical protein